MEKLRDGRIPPQLISLAEDHADCAVSVIEPLKGDGSDRAIFRLCFQETSQEPVIGVFFTKVQENRDFFRVTHAFREAGLAAPRILAVGEDEQVYLIQDLGRYTLADRVRQWREAGEEKMIVAAYRQVLDNLVRIQRDLPPILERFLDRKRMNLSVYRADIEYFKREFIIRFQFEEMLTAGVLAEIGSILHDHLSEIDCSSFVYRDFQARNIMWPEDMPWFIDYQSAFLGPRYYDLASLLFGSKAGLTDREREILLHHYFQSTQFAGECDFKDFLDVFYLFVVIRRLRSLGSYGFLGKARGKESFLMSILPTLVEMKQLFQSKSGLKSYGHLGQMVEALHEAWTSVAAGLGSRSNLDG